MIMVSSFASYSFKVNELNVNAFLILFILTQYSMLILATGSLFVSYLIIDQVFLYSYPCVFCCFQINAFYFRSFGSPYLFVLLSVPSLGSL